MPFTSPSFLFLFLPIILGAYWLCPWRGARNLLLLAVSLFVYAWGEGRFVLLLASSVLWNYALGIWLAGTGEGRRRRALFVVAVAVNLAPLVVLKYAGFIVGNLNALASLVRLPALTPPDWPLPAGVSFFTFMALSYIIGVHRREVEGERNPLVLGLYITLFPIIMAGPIVRYKDLAPQLARASLDSGAAAEGARRFVLGLAKKALIANTLAEPANAIFSLPAGELSASVAWFGIACYTLQIFFDFSGYSDMAIGIGRMLGFRFLENFNYPYAATSLRMFWGRWHISLSTWFRDYVFLPVAYPLSRVLERVRFVRMRVDFCSYAASTAVTMLLIGLWHGASWSFVAWGLYQAVFLVIERTRMGKRLGKAPSAVQHTFTLLVVMVGWVIFRAVTMSQAAGFLSAMAGFGGAAGFRVTRYAGGDVVLALVAGALFSTRVGPASGAWLRSRMAGDGWSDPILAVCEAVGAVCLLMISLSWLSAGTFMPFIYFRF